MRDRSELKRKYPSGASKRKKKKDGTKNNAGISPYFAACGGTRSSSHTRQRKGRYLTGQNFVGQN